jgi:nucleoside transporter
MEATSAVPFLRTRLFGQMFLQFATQGAFMPILGKHMENLKFSPEEQGLVFTAAGVAPVVLPLVAGQSIDRWFAAQRVLSLCYFVTGALLLIAGNTTGYLPMVWLSFGVAMFFGPSIPLGNALCFHHLTDARRDFPIIRLGGTLGYILAGWILSAWIIVYSKLYATERPIGDGLLLAGVLGIANGIYCLTLPHTPPKSDAVDKFALGKVLAMLKDPSFVVLSLMAFVMAIFAAFYFTKAGNFLPSIGIPDKLLAVVLSTGQVMEILTMLLLPWFYRRFGSKMTMGVGLAAWLIRYVVFASCTNVVLILAAQALHGFCFAFAMAAAMIYVDRICASDVRGSMQSFLGWLMACGGLLGAYAAGWVHGFYTKDGVSDWSKIWMVPTLGFVVVLVLFLVGFRARDDEAAAAVPAATA